ncbi:hypothetical protein ACFSTE_13285 [Aquimarina hainanensis]|uniref:Uncharacterized protein n=1 Tax=Aquimarina hainanensis TaxID=1578017 RepID=A0ABW5NCA4_9FLAO
MIEVYINGRRADTDENTLIVETKQINDFFEIKDRQTGVTNRFRLPWTPNNNLIFDMLGMDGSKSVLPYRISSIEVRREGITTIENGSMIIGDVIEESYYEIYAYDGIIDIYNAIGDTKISSVLDIPEILLTDTSWKNSFSNTWEDGFTFPVADYGKIDGDIIEYNYQAPCVFIKYIWNKIFEITGFKYEYLGNDNLFEWEDFEEMAISVDRGYSSKTESVPAEKILTINGEKEIDIRGVSMDLGGQIVIITPINRDNIHYLKLEESIDTQEIHLYSSSNQFDRSRIKISNDGFYKLDISCFVRVRRVNNLRLVVEKNGIDLFEVKNNFSQGENIFDFTRRIYLRKNEELYIKFLADPSENQIRYNYNLTLDLFIDNSNVVINFNSYLTSTSLKQVMKDVMHHYGLITQRTKKTYYFKRIEDLLNDYKNSEDWSGKFHKKVKKSSKVGNYAQSNYLRYQYDNKDDDFADSVIKIDDTTISENKEIIRRAFKAPDSSSYIIDGQVLRKAPLFEKELEKDGTVKSIKPKKSKPFLLRIERRQASFEYKVSGSSNTNTHSGITPFATFRDYDHNELVALNYTSFGNMINQGKKLWIEAYITPLDIHFLNFMKLKYIKQLGELVYINKVNYSGYNTSKCEVIPVSIVEQNGEYDDDYSTDYNI